MNQLARTNGFDYLRLILSVSVVVSHTVLSSYGVEAQAALSASPLGILNRLILPMFFALSGYLVTGSLFRCKTLISFAGLRAIRLIPALSFEVALSALLLGPIFTSLPIWNYFSDPEFFIYFLNIVGEIHFVLPGVFEKNPYPNIVNVQLWTIPWELYCYTSLIGLAILRQTTRRIRMVVFVIFLQMILMIYAFYKHRSGLTITNGSSGPVLFTSFFSGFVLFLFKDEIRWTKSFFITAAGMSLILESLPAGNYAVALPSAYMTVFLGRCNPRLIFPLNKGDYSYGIYLFGLPIQQSIASLGPDFQHWYINLLFGIPLIVFVAVISWHFVERPALKRRNLIARLEQFWLRLNWRATTRIRTMWLRIGSD